METKHWQKSKAISAIKLLFSQYEESTEKIHRSGLSLKTPPLSNAITSICHVATVTFRRPEPRSAFDIYAFGGSSRSGDANLIDLVFFLNQGISSWNFTVESNWPMSRSFSSLVKIRSIFLVEMCHWKTGQISVSSAGLKNSKFKLSHLHLKWWNIFMKLDNRVELSYVLVILKFG